MFNIREKTTRTKKLENGNKPRVELELRYHLVRQDKAWDS